MRTPLSIVTQLLNDLIICQSKMHRQSKSESEESSEDEDNQPVTGIERFDDLVTHIDL